MPTPRHPHLTALLTATALTILPTLARAQSPAQPSSSLTSDLRPLTSPPNILFILVDDLGVTDFACTGSSFYETPHIDALAKSSITFTQAYAPCPVCSPSRASLLTGQNPVRTTITDYIGGHATGKLLPAPYSDFLPDSEITFPQTLHDHAHYQTWHVGKWHLGPKGHWPTHYGYDLNIAGYAAGHPRSYFPPYKNPTLKDGPPDEYLTDRLTNESINLIKHRDKSRPFLLSLWHYAVHTPLQAPPALVEKYQQKAHRLGLDTQQALVQGEHFPRSKKPTNTSPAANSNPTPPTPPWSNPSTTASAAS